MKPRVLIACEFSGIVRDAFTQVGCDATSCDLLPTERPGKHIQGDVLEILNDGWDLMVAHPPCTHLCSRGQYWAKQKNQLHLVERAIIFFLELYTSDIPKIAVENPVGVMSTRFRKPDQYAQPFHHGHPERKKTGLWLKNLPLLIPTNECIPAGPAFIDRSGHKRYFVDMQPPSPNRWKIRSKTFSGIARAMAEQWGRPLVVREFPES